MSKNNMPCDVCKDLLPSHIDGLLSEKTKELVEEHLETCESCKVSYRSMLQPEEREMFLAAEENKNSIRYLKKIKKKQRIKNTVSVAITLLVAVALFTYLAVRDYALPVSKMEIVESYQLDENRMYFKIKMDSSLASIDAYSFMSGLKDDDGKTLKNNIEEATQFEIRLGYSLSSRLTRERGIKTGYYHLTVYNGPSKVEEDYNMFENIDSIYLRGRTRNERLLLWQEGDKLEPAPAEIIEDINQHGQHGFWVTPS